MVSTLYRDIPVIPKNALEQYIIMEILGRKIGGGTGFQVKRSRHIQ